MTTFAFKADTLYIACSPELGVFSFGHCQDEALNNLTDEIRERSGLASELAKKKIAMPSTDRPFRCALCRRRFHSQRSLADHCRLEHTQPRQCRNCGKQLRENEFHRC
jgi:hypothetical protein